MAGMNMLRPVLQRAIQASLKQQWQKGTLCLPVVASQSLSVREMGAHGPRKMIKIPSRYEWDSFKDDVNFFLWLGLLPMGIVIFYANMFIGQAELRDIPEGYEPKHWEYLKSPIQRWFAKYVYNNPEDDYEKVLQTLYIENEKMKMRELDAKVKSLMAKRMDYKGWYYIPVDKTNVDKGKEQLEDWNSKIGSKIQ